jgi:hypothetical protein
MSTLASPKNSPFTLCVQNIRKWEDRHLPRSKSYIAFDLFILIGHTARLEQPMTLKELCNSLKHSERGIRYVLDQFVDGGWCEIVENEKDRRFRHIVATDLLKTRLLEYEQQVLSAYNTIFVNVP